MRIPADRIETELSKKLLPLYLVTGDEPLIMQEVLDNIRKCCKESGFSERKILDVDRFFDWSTLDEEVNCLSLFAEQKLIEIRLGNSKPGAKGSKAILHYCSNLPEDNILLISSAKLDASTLKSKWASTLDKIGAIVQIWPINLNEMPKWIAQRAMKIGLNIDQGAILLLADRLEGNLLAGQQELEKLKLQFGDSLINTDKVLNSVSDSAKYDIFDLTDACLSGNAKLALKIMTHLRMEGAQATVVLWALSKEIRLVIALRQALNNNASIQTVFKEYRVFAKRQSMLSQTAKRMSQANLNLLLDRCKQTDDRIKGIEKGLEPWSTLVDIALGLSGKDLFIERRDSA